MLTLWLIKYFSLVSRKRSNKRGLRSGRINLGVFFDAVQQVVDTQQKTNETIANVPDIEIQLQLNITSETEEAAEPQTPIG